MKFSRPRACVAALAVAALAVGAVGVLSPGTASAALTVGAPALVGPNATLPVLKDVRLAWSPVSGATGYQVEVGTDGAWSDNPTWTSTSAGTQLALPSWLPHASYVWHVAAMQGAARGDWSVNGSFTKGWRDRPSLTVPSVGQVVSGIPTFSWVGIKDASAYELQLSTCPSFDDKTPSSASACPPGAAPAPSSVDNTPTQDQARPVVDTCFTTHTTVTPFTEEAQHGQDNAGSCVFTQLASGKPLYWRVRGADRFIGSAPDVETTPASSAGISHQPPSAFPTIADVTSGCPSTATVPTASPSASASPSSSATPSSSPSPSAPASAQPGSCGPTHPVESSAWSETHSFGITLTAQTAGDYNALPLVTTNALDASTCKADGNSAAVDGSTTPNDNLVCADFPTISWQPVAGATAYRVYVSLDDSYTNIQRIIETPALQWTPTDNWRQSDVNSSYYYVVQPCTDKGCGAVRPDPHSFRKSTPAVAAVAPLSGSPVLGVGQPMSFLWKDLMDTVAAKTGAPSTLEAYSYHLQVADKAANPGFSNGSLALDISTDGVLCTQAATGTAVAGKTDPAVQTCDGSQVFSAASVGSVVGYVPDTTSLPDGTYQWRVQAVDASAHRLPYSDKQTFTVDTTPPTISGLNPSSRIGVKQSLVVSFSEPVTGVSAGSLSLSPAAPFTLSVPDSTTAVLTPTRPFVPGTTYRVLVGSAVHDAAGNAAVNAAPAFTVQTDLDDSSPAATYTGSWSRAGSSNAKGGSYRSSNPAPRANTSVTVPFRGTGVDLVGCRMPTGGYVDVYVDGARRARVSTYRSYSGCGITLAAVRGLGRGAQHTLKVVGIGAHQAGAKGNRVAVDGFLVTP